MSLKFRSFHLPFLGPSARDFLLAQRSTNIDSLFNFPRDSCSRDKLIFISCIFLCINIMTFPRIIQTSVNSSDSGTSSLQTIPARIRWTCVTTYRVSSHRRERSKSRYSFPDLQGSNRSFSMLWCRVVWWNRENRWYCSCCCVPSCAARIYAAATPISSSGKICGRPVVNRCTPRWLV